MDPALLATLALLAAVVVGLVAALAVLLAGRRRLERDLRSSRREVADVQVRLEQLEATLEAARRASSDDLAPDHEYLITSLPGGPVPHAGPAAPEAEQHAAVSAREFTSLAVSESVIRVASLAHGVRRALSAENRNRLRFEIRREVRRSRKQRRAEVRQTRRHLRARQAGLSQDAA